MRVLLVTTMRNEGANILDWVAYHRAIGVTDILVYTNDCEDGSPALLDALAERGDVIHEPNPRTGDKPIQWQALNRASKHPAFEAADWVISADVDEYLTIHAGEGCIADLLTAAPQAKGFAIPWRLFGNGGETGLTGQPVPQRFTRAAPADLLWPFRARCYKALWRNDGTFRKIGVHRPQGVDRARYDPRDWVDGSGTPVPHDITQGLLPAIRTPAPPYVLAQWSHYAVGTPEDFLIKAARGKPNKEAEAIGLEYWIDNNFCTEPDTSTAGRFALAAPLRADYAADPALSALRADALAWRHTKLAAILEDEPTFRLYAALRQLPATTPLPAQEQARLWAHHVKLATRRRAAQGQT